MRFGIRRTGQMFRLSVLTLTTIAVALATACGGSGAATATPQQTATPAGGEEVGQEVTMPGCEALLSEEEVRALLPGAHEYEFAGTTEPVVDETFGTRITCTWFMDMADRRIPSGWVDHLLVDVRHYADSSMLRDDPSVQCVASAGGADLSDYGTLCVGRSDTLDQTCGYYVHRLLHMAGNKVISVILESKDYDRESCGPRHTTQEMQDIAAQAALLMASRLR